MTLAEAPMVTPKTALKYIYETNQPVLDMMIQFASQEADCLFTDFNHIRNWYPSSPQMYEDVQTRWQYENVGTKKSPENHHLRLWKSPGDAYQ